MGNLPKALFAGILLALALCSHALAQGWTQLVPGGSAPNPRTLHSAVLSPASNRMIVFGGLNGPGTVTTHPMFNDVWVLSSADASNGTPAWTRLFPTGTPPSARGHGTAVHDAANNRMIVFAGDPNIGFCNGATNDVWVLANADGTGGTPSWTPLSPTGTPPAMRQGTRAVYDPVSNRLIAFGGRTNACQALNDRETWVLSNANGLGGTPAWSRLAPEGTLPPARAHHVQVYDAPNNRVIVFGGAPDTGDTNDVWVLENANGLGGTPRWTQLSPSGTPPAPRSLSSAAYDPASNRLVVFGGTIAGGRDNQTWVLQHANGLGGTPSWSPLTPSGAPPAARDTHTAVFNAATKRLVVFGGRTCTGGCSGSEFSALNDTWMLTNATGITATASAQDFVVFDDSARNGFDGAFSFGGGTNLAEAGTVFSGTASISYTGNDQFNAVSFGRIGDGVSDIPVSSYHTLRFYVHGGATGGQRLRLYFARNSETEAVTVASRVIDPYIVGGGGIRANEWRLVSVPLADFGVDEAYDRIDFQTELGAQPELYLDEIVLVGAPMIEAATVIVPRGVSSVEVPVRYFAGMDVRRMEFSLRFVRSPPVAASGSVTARAGALAPDGAVSCNQSGTGNEVGGVANSQAGFPLQSGTLCTFTFPLDPSAPNGDYRFIAGASAPSFTDTQDGPVEGNFLAGGIVIADGTSPSVSYTPPPPSQIDLPGGALGTPVRATINVQSLGGSGVGRVRLACSVGAPFALPDGGTFLVGAGDPAFELAIGCTPGAADAIGELDCTETDEPGGTQRARSWPLVCPQGSAAGFSADEVTANRGGPVGVGIRFIGDGIVYSMAGDLVFDRTRLTPTQVSPANGGNCFLRPAPNDDRIAVSVPPGPQPLDAAETTYCNVVFLLAGNAPIDVSPLTFAATACLNDVNAGVTCLANDGSVTTSAFDSSPRPGNALSLVAAPGQTSVSGSIVTINFGAAPIRVASCTPEPADGFSVTPSGAFSLAGFDFGSVTVGCTPPASGLPPRVSDVSCVLEDTAPPRVVRYRVLCSNGASQGPVPGASLTGAGAGAGDEVGTALATTLLPSGEEIMVVGAPFGGADNGGRAFVIVRAAGLPPAAPQSKGASSIGAWDEALSGSTAHALSATNAIGDKFGNAVAIDSAGTTIAIGAPGGGPGGAGRVLVFERPAGGWGPLETPNRVIEAPSGAAAGDTVPDEFGAELAFTANGMLVVGAPLADVGAGAPDAGAAYAYAGNSVVPAAIVRAPQVETGAGFGGAIASDGDAIAIGAPLENAGGNSDQGAVYVMTAPGAPAEPTRRVTAASGSIGDKFGQSVAIANGMLVVGAPSDNTATGTDAGSATVYSGDAGSGFVERMTLAPAGDSAQQAGASVATNGDVILLGAPFAPVAGRPAQGRVFAYDVPESFTAPPPAATIIDGPAGQAGDRFGARLAASERRLLIGVPKDDNELGIGGTTVQVDEGRADPFLFDRISRSGFE